MAMVKIIILVPSGMLENKLILELKKERIKLIMIIPVITLLFLAGGMIMPINIPYRATLNAETSLSGKILPATIPSAVPKDHMGMAKAPAP